MFGQPATQSLDEDKPGKLRTIVTFFIYILVNDIVATTYLFFQI